jgi:hypothetical protein
VSTTIRLSAPAAIAIGAVVLYAVGRWDQRLTDRDAEQRAAVTAILKSRRAYWSRVDSLRAVQDAAEAKARRLRALAHLLGDSLRALSDSLARHSDSLSRAPLGEALAGLPLRALGPDRFETDSTGARQIAQFKAKADEAVVLIPALRKLAEVAQARADTLELVALPAARLRADSAEARILTLERLLEADRRLHRCRIAALIPCPSRVTAYVLGLATAALIVTR